MEMISNILSVFPTISMDHVNALVALAGALALVAFAIYVVVAVASDRGNR
jgi:hypothetical protein